MVRLGYVRFSLVRFSYIRFLYFLPKSYAFHPRLFFPQIAILWPLTKQQTFYTNGQGSLCISPLNRGSTVLLMGRGTGEGWVTRASSLVAPANDSSYEEGGDI